MVNLFEWAIGEGYLVYPEILGYHYIEDIQRHPGMLDEINCYDMVFISSDHADPIPGCRAVQMMTSAEYDGTFMWMLQDYTDYQQLPHSEYTEVPTVGFVGRCPIFVNDIGEKLLHRGFEPRYYALSEIIQSQKVCNDFHIRFIPEGDSAGFWNESLPSYVKDQPLFKTNMLANQYQVCARGNANWSLRFFETLAYGRIPVYVESGGKTPADYYFGELNKRVEELPFVYVVDPKDIEWEILKFHAHMMIS